MLTITVPASERWDESRNEFVYSDKQVLNLEHSLVSISEWESKWHKPFLSNTNKTMDETVDYIRCMTLNRSEVKNDAVYGCLSPENVKEIQDYIANPMTATRIKKEVHGNNTGELTTSELIYYWMVALQIPFECQNWPLARLMVLIRICNIKNQPAKKMKPQETISRYAALNAARKKQLGTHG
mgnify:CR=1 FL=1